MMKNILSLCMLGIGLFACTVEHDRPIVAVQGPALPHPVSNNAVAGFRSDDGFHLRSFLGLSAGRSWQDVASEAWHLPPGSAIWERLSDVPGGEGRLAATAAVVAGNVYVFGGYTVAEDGSERSVGAVYRLDTRQFGWHELAPMPIPVDDAVSVVYQDRFVYLISGWHDLGSVNLVQIYDVQKDSWIQATPWPGEAVFGHAGGIVGNRMLICDGVAVRLGDSGSRHFEPVDDCYLGEIDSGDFRRIRWQTVEHHPGPARYRMAATGREKHDGEIVFAGGSDNPYNYDGMGYDGNVSKASAEVFAWQLVERQWVSYGRLPVATMDHRGMPGNTDTFFIIGGMVNADNSVDDSVPALSSLVHEFTLQ
jgi:N-acetylneuraminic acid mutarotase